MPPSIAMRFGVASVLITAAIAAVSALAQQVAPAFDVASVKRSPPFLDRVLQPFVGVPQPGVWRLRDSTVIAAIRSAYPGHPLSVQIAGAPEWASRDYYDIDARWDPAASADDVRQMVRTLLAERFKLAIHEEQREVPAFVLATRKSGTLGRGLQPPSVDCTAFRAGGPRPNDPKRKPYADRLACGVTVMPVFDHTLQVAGADMRLTAGDVSIGEVLTLLGNRLDRPVVDRTGLTQRFDVELQFQAGPVHSDGDNGPPIRAAISEQLGLDVQEGQTSIGILVIDRLEQPDEN
jgi:uncharacterized protein (TIGR03435 family)